MYDDGCKDGWEAERNKLVVDYWKTRRSGMKVEIIGHNLATTMQTMRRGQIAVVKLEGPYYGQVVIKLHDKVFSLHKTGAWWSDGGDIPVEILAPGTVVQLTIE